jgi:hypothetical protein
MIFLITISLKTAATIIILQERRLVEVGVRDIYFVPGEFNLIMQRAQGYEAFAYSINF